MNASVETLPNIAETQASALATAATLLDQAKQNRSEVAELVGALDFNMQLWVAINCLANMPECNLSIEVKSNLAILNRYVRDITFKNGANISDELLDTLVGINLRIADGLLVGVDQLKPA